MHVHELRLPSAPAERISIHGLWERYGASYVEALRTGNLWLQDEVLRIIRSHAADWYAPSSEDLQLLEAMDPDARGELVATWLALRALRVHQGGDNHLTIEGR